ncbi:MAG: TIGR02680 family protein [Proteobacteria bacterium]|nr:TIGR02680 family protein [Pseudomonadota bacterium]
MRAVGSRPEAATERAQRWMLSRAGIVNVYQYGNEILHFAGGRLLLRGVNGSGKSTAMNMLLPFLLDADTRRIDAAGEQSGVLRSWMLSGREEPQPQGYLWLEVAKGESYLSFGCGIRASRATDQVTTWWFITSRRPGIDLSLVEGRVPVSREALRAAIAPDLLFGHEQRAGYRAELRRRLFGGADIEQHLHLLRIVRNPRVGDRLDAELPQYLQDALPQLSDAALDDAAQPLEDLEEHRRNVADLRRTADTLNALDATYRNYARTELHRLADGTFEAARISRERRRDEEKAQRAHDEAVARRRAAELRKRELQNEVEQLRSAIETLKASEAYTSGAQLNDLRGHVGSLERTKAAAEEAFQRMRAASERAANAVRGARQEVAADHDALRRRLSELGNFASTCQVTARPPIAPFIDFDRDSSGDLELAPAVPIDTAAADRALAGLAAAARQRIEEVGTVAAAVAAIEPAERAVRAAERAAADAQSASDEAREAVGDAHIRFQSVIDVWQEAASDWIGGVQRHCAAYGLGAIQAPAEAGAAVDYIASGYRIDPVLEALITPAVRYHETLRAQREASLKLQGKLVEELAARAAELAAKQLPDSPTLGWQRRARPCLAELIDFAGHVAPATRAAVEAALEASGLLAAEVHADGTLRLVDGQLVIAPGATDAPAPLSALLRPDIPVGDDINGETRNAVERILRAISTDWAAEAQTIVTIDGQFRIGAVRGRYLKPEPEHIGLTARRAALERQRAESERALEQAKAEQARIARELQAARVALDEALSMRDRIPSDQELHAAMWQRTEAERALEKAEALLHLRRSELQTAEQQHSEAVSSARATAARLSLPVLPAELRGLRADLGRMIPDCREAQGELARLSRTVGRWRERGSDWRAARADEETSGAYLTSVLQELVSAQQRLATLDATIGVAYEEVVAAVAGKDQQLTAARESAEQADEALESAVVEVTVTAKNRESAADERDRADGACVQALGVLERALGVPGLREAAIEPPKTEADGVTAADERPAGPAGAPLLALAEASLGAEDAAASARRLVELIRAQVPRPAEPATTAEGVRVSIRRRRDSLGAGWDAEDRQPDEHLPLHVEVTGPLAHQTPLPAAAQIVQRQLATLAGLLSTKQHQALRNLLQGLVAREIAEKLHSASELIDRMNERLAAITTSHGIGVRLRWRRRDDLDPSLAETVELLAKPPDLRTAEEDGRLSEALGRRIDDAHREDPGTPYRELIARVLDYREWHAMTILLHRPGRPAERLGRRTALSEGEKKIVSYLPLFAAVAASCDGLAASEPGALRFVLLDDAFAKVSEDNHAKLFGLLVELDLDFVATSERLWGTHDTVPQLAITEVIRDADLETIVLEHSRWDGRRREAAS